MAPKRRAKAAAKVEATAESPDRPAKRARTEEPQESQPVSDVVPIASDEQPLQPDDPPQAVEERQFQDDLDVNGTSLQAEEPKASDLYLDTVRSAFWKSASPHCDYGRSDQQSLTRL